MPRTKRTNVRRPSPFEKKSEAEKREASEVESELSSSPKPEETSDRQEPDNEDTPPVVRRYRMKLIPPHYGNPHRYKDYTPEPAGGSVSGGEPVAGGSGLAKACEHKHSPRARQDQSGAGKRGRILESPDRSAHSRRHAGHDKVRKSKKNRNKRRLKRAAKPKKDASSSSLDLSSIDSAELGSSGGNHADCSSSEQEQPNKAKRVK